MKKKVETLTIDYQNTSIKSTNLFISLKLDGKSLDEKSMIKMELDIESLKTVILNDPMFSNKIVLKSKKKNHLPGFKRSLEEEPSVVKCK